MKGLIEKMSFVSITGPKGDIDRIVDDYISKYEIQLEYAPSELKSINTLYPYVGQNPYKEQLAYGEELSNMYGQGKYNSFDISVKESTEFITGLYRYIKERKNRLEEMEAELAGQRERLNKVLPFKTVNYNIDEILGFKSMRFRFGRIPKENYIKFIDYVESDLASVFVKATEDEKYVWGIYFVALTEKESVDAAYTSLHFERTFIPDDTHGTPDEAISYYEKKIKIISQNIDNEKIVIRERLNRDRERFFNSYETLRTYVKNYDIRKYAACTKEDGLAYFILCGWMTEKDAQLLEFDITKGEPDTICIVDRGNETTDSNPPTKLKNPRLVKPFEMFVRMYGMPSYNEIDPTIFVAVTYAFIFGAMFGDVGQGLCLFLGGLLLYKIKKIDLAAIIGAAGFFSTIFGFLYGSLFGFEDILPHLWLSPAKAMTNLPFVGRLNTVFVVSIVFGMGLVIIAMIMHIINAVKAKDMENKWFDANGVAGLVFYVSVAAAIILFMTGNKLPAGIVMAVMFVVPLIIIALKEPLTHIIQKRKAVEGSVGMFATQTFFEMFEVLLSYFSNTLSFIRIGAFAVSHAAMMEVVLMLAGAENGRMGNIVVIIIGNIVVCGLEGLIVGIQVLRLEYYEIFSRFYKGTGREFKPYNEKKMILNNNKR